MTDLKADAVIILDSIAPSGVRVTTAVVRIATMVLQDVHTHRTVYQYTHDQDAYWADIVSNKSANSNRAKTTKQVLREVWKTPFCPTRFPKRASTMHSSRGHHEIGSWQYNVARFVWLKSRYLMMLAAMILMCIPGVHKQVANRLLMPWTWTVLTMTAIDVYWRHFKALRAHPAAQDEVQEAAYAFARAYDASTPVWVPEGEWHLPFVTDEEYQTLPITTLIQLSVARCARTSYVTDLQTMLIIASMRPLEEDVDLFCRLEEYNPPHEGPKEHQSKAHSDPNHRSGTLFGWDQLRHDPMIDAVGLLARKRTEQRYHSTAS